MLARITTPLPLLGGSTKTHSAKFTLALAQANQDLHLRGKMCLGLPEKTGTNPIF